MKTGSRTRLDGPHHPSERKRRRGPRTGRRAPLAVAGPGRGAARGLPEDPMFAALLLALAVGQVPAPAPDQAAAAAPAAPPAPDRWLLMKSLQGTWPGALLDDNHLSISGWTDASFTASSV